MNGSKTNRSTSPGPGTYQIVSAFFVWRTGAAREIVAGHLLYIIIVTSICFNPPDGRWCTLPIVDALEGGATCKGIFTDKTDCFRQIDFAEIGCSLEGSAGYTTAVLVDGISGVPAACRIAHENLVLGSLIANGIEYTIDSFVLVHVGPIDVT